MAVDRRDVDCNTVPDPLHLDSSIFARPVPEGFVRRASCALCDAPASESRVHIDFPDIPVLRCVRCEFMYSAWTMSAEAMADYYQNEFASDWHRRGQELNSRINAAALRHLIDLRGVKSWLDVGTGYGFLLQRLSARHGIDCVGVEPSIREAQWGVENLGVRIVPKWLDDAGLDAEGFDVVSCFEVIEHAPDPRALVASMCRHCRPGGIVIVNTDNFESDVVKSLGPAFPKWIPHSHVSHFAPATLRKCVEDVGGLRIERMLSHTAWEMRVRSILARQHAARPPAECFNLQSVREREMKRTYRFWPLRLAMSRAGFALTRRGDLRGSMMYVAARRKP